MSTVLKILAILLCFTEVACKSVNPTIKRDPVGSIINAPFALAAGVIETATMPLGGGKPQWVRNAEVSRMKLDKPKLEDPRWAKKFSNELASGDVYLPTFAQNLKAYEMTKKEKYLSHAEQLAKTDQEKGELELVALTALGPKAFDANITIDGRSTTPKYNSDQGRILFIATTVNGATVHPRGGATLTLRSDLPFALHSSYTVTAVFTFTIPRESTVVFMGVSNTRDSPSVSHITKTFTFAPGKRSASCDLDFGQVNGANTSAALGATGKRRVTGSPFTDFTIQKITRN